MNNNSSSDNGTPVLAGMTTVEDLWTSREVARFLHVSLKTVFNLRKKGLPFVQVGGAVRFVPQEIKDYLAKNRGLSLHRSRQIIRKGGTIV
jgi:excisionase family DNA binding protein